MLGIKQIDASSPLRPGDLFSSADSFDLYRCPVRQNFRDALHDFIRVIPHRQNCVRSMFCCMLQQQLVRFSSCLFT